MTIYYRENDGDFLAVNTETKQPWPTIFGKVRYEARATAIKGLASSVCTCGVSDAYLKKNCKRVSKAKTPANWLKAIGM